MAYISFQPSDFFNAVLYTGTGGTQSISGVGFQPDFVWLKDRVLTYDHQLHDSNRGASAGYLASNNTNTENPTYPLSSFDSDGWTTVSGGTPGQNASGDTFVSWNWKANSGTTSSNTDGSITSTVQANTTAGFSIITWTGNSTLGATIGHGLGKKPSMFIIKNRDLGGVNDNWRTYHESLGATKYLVLNTNDASSTGLGNFNNTEPTTSVITLGNADATNGNTYSMLCYAFAEIKGYSKFGSYTGNANADGPFIYTGFRPAFVMIKGSSIAENWVMQDTARDPYNLVYHRLDAERTNAETTNIGSLHPNMDYVSNGFKIRGSANVSNGSGQTYIYMAFAEFPVVGSNGTAGTAR